MNAPRFDYDTAFSRNIGWVLPEEQQRLKSARIAIGGLGGVGGAHLLTLVRLGIERFSIADFDVFAVHNFNRQAGAMMSTFGQPKADVLDRMAKDINPDCDIRLFHEGVTRDNLGAFLDGVDVYVDGIDFFALDARRMIFAACHARGIPAITAAPLGIGASLLYFAPERMSFESYFKLDGLPRQEQLARFIAGLSPAMLQRHYLVAPDAVNFVAESGPSTVMACNLCSGLIGDAVLKLVLRRGSLRPVPWAMQFDAHKQRLRFTWRPFGNANPLQRMLLWFIRPRLRGKPA
ncbi:MAG: ThiF family adenylyltransferase [Ideonella sp.]|nr:ThiF family adenylyltransferase [Ideonella sp.]